MIVTWAFRNGTANYPKGVEGPFATKDEAMQAKGHFADTGRVRRATPEEIEQARAKMREGRMPVGW